MACLSKSGENRHSERPWEAVLVSLLVPRLVVVNRGDRI